MKTCYDSVLFYLILKIYFLFYFFVFIIINMKSIKILYSFFFNTSNNGDPVTNTWSLRNPSLNRYLRLCSVYVKLISEIWSEIFLLISSGTFWSKHLLPASMWKIGIFNLFAEMVLRTLFVYPNTSRASGFSFRKI